MSAPRKVPILTVFAGPNGSGKSTLVARLLSEVKFGVLVNADDIAKSIAVRKCEAAPSQETQWEAAISAEEMRWALLSQNNWGQTTVSGPCEFPPLAAVPPTPTSAHRGNGILTVYIQYL